MAKCKKDKLYSPLHNLEQALLLAIRCKMSIHIGTDVSWVELPTGEFVSVEHKEIGDVAATCKAIVFAATKEIKL